MLILLALKTGLEEAAKNAGLLKDNASAIPLEARLGQLIGSALALVGILFMILMIYGGFKWMTAGGKAEEAQKAQTIIKNSIIGLIIVVAAYLITSFVLQEILKGVGLPPATG